MSCYPLDQNIVICYITESTTTAYSSGFPICFLTRCSLEFVQTINALFTAHPRISLMIQYAKRTPALSSECVPPPAYTPSPVSPYPEKGEMHLSLSPCSASSSPPHGANTLRFPSSNSSSLAPAQPSPPQTPARQRTPTMATPTSPAIELIRETLYAALADVLESTPSLIPYTVKYRLRSYRSPYRPVEARS
jgi:hypothetical protein